MADKAQTVGRRKNAIARVVLAEGKGNIIVNGEPLEDYFKKVETLVGVVMEPLKILKVTDKYDFTVITNGGGIHGQAEAIRHGISRALNEIDATFHTVLKKAGFLSRDPRAVERKKPGRPKARKRFQFSKR